MKHYKNLSVLVTGGAGFIGSHLVEKLVEHQAHVTVLDDLSSGTIENLAAVANRIVFIKKSVTDMNACLKATKNQSLVFHLAAVTSVQKSFEYPQECHAINVNGTFNILEASRINKVTRMVFSSSAAVYGAQTQPCSELSTCAPTSVYGFSKFIGELYCKQFSQAYGFSTVCLRYFNVYGPRQVLSGPYATVVGQFEHAMQHNLPITIFGNGCQTRDFVPIHAIVQANLNVGAYPLQERIEIFNIASGSSITILELIEQLKKKYPLFNAPLIFKPARVGDIYLSSAVCSKYKALSTISMS